MSVAEAFDKQNLAFLAKLHPPLPPKAAIDPAWCEFRTYTERPGEDFWLGFVTRLRVLTDKLQAVGLWPRLVAIPDDDLSPLEQEARKFYLMTAEADDLQAVATMLGGGAEALTGAGQSAWLEAIRHGVVEKLLKDEVEPVLRGGETEALPGEGQGLVASSLPADATEAVAVNVLYGWAKILACLGQDGSNIDHIRSLNKTKDGPIQTKQGGKPTVIRHELVAWWNRLHTMHKDAADRERREFLAAKDTLSGVGGTYFHGRDETVAPEICGSVRQRRVPESS